jgi:hypothetical protein
MADIPRNFGYNTTQHPRLELSSSSQWNHSTTPRPLSREV